MADRVDLIRRLIRAGATRIEVAGFVHPERVPQMSDAEEVVAALPDDDSVSYIGLVLNRRGLERALETKVDEINFVVPATESYTRQNQGMAQSEALALAEQLIPEAQAAQRRTTVTISVAFGDPHEREVDAETVAEVARRVAMAGADEVALGDTIGAAVPTDVVRRLEAVHEVSGGVPMRCHFHNTRNTGYANAVAALDAGVRVLDAAVGGYGGSPFAPGAGGNIATEDLAHMLDRMGVDTGLSIEGLVETTDWLAARLGTPPAAMLGRAGRFPPEAPSL